MIGEGGEDRREALDDLAQTPEANEAREEVAAMRRRVAAAQAEVERS